MKDIVSLRGKKKFLRVTFPDERSICYSNATITFIEVLKQIGVKRFPEITLEIGHLPMITKDIYPKYKGYMKPIMDGWFVNTQSDTEQKFLQLCSINDKLNLGLIVEIGTNFEITDKPIGKQKKSAKNDLLVKFPDGEFIAGENPVDTYIQSIWKIGIDELQRKELFISNKKLITRTHLYNNQIQVGVNQWLTVPNGTKDKVKTLRYIAAIMHVSLNISIL